MDFKLIDSHVHFDVKGYVKQYFDEQRRACIELGMKPYEVKQIFRDNIAKLLKLGEKE